MKDSKLKTETVHVSADAEVPVGIEDLEGCRLELVYSVEDVSIASEWPQLNDDGNGNMLKVVIGNVAAFIRDLAKIQGVVAALHDSGLCCVPKVCDMLAAQVWIETYDDDWRAGMDTLLVYDDTAYMMIEGKWDPSDSYEVELPTIYELIKLAREKGTKPKGDAGEGE